jgi:hypothetical protein
MSTPYKKFSEVFPPDSSDDDEEELVEALPAAQTVSGLITTTYINSIVCSTFSKC